MGNVLLNDDYLSVRCSGIGQYNDDKMFIVNYDYFDIETSKQCGIQIPQFHLVYNDGFSDDEIAYLYKLTADNLDELIAAAMKMPVPSEDGADVSDETA